jgi:ribosome-associated protein
MWNKRVTEAMRERSLAETVKAASTLSARELAYKAANIAESKKAISTLVLDVVKVTPLADFFVITGGDSVTQVRAIVDAIDETLSKYGWQPRSIEGKLEGRWVLMDYEVIIVHVFHQKERDYYKLEQFWNHANPVERLDWYDDNT